MAEPFSFDVLELLAVRARWHEEAAHVRAVRRTLAVAAAAGLGSPHVAAALAGFLDRSDTRLAALAAEAEGQAEAVDHALRLGLEADAAAGLGFRAS